MTTRLVVYAFSNHQTISNPLKSWPRASQSCSWQDESSCVAPSPQKWLSAIAIIWKTHQLASWTSKLWAAHSHGRCSWHKQLSECPVWSKHESVKREEWKALETTMERISQWNYMELCYMNIMHSLLFHTIAQAGGWPFEIAPLSLCHMARHNSTWTSPFSIFQHVSQHVSRCSNATSSFVLKRETSHSHQGRAMFPSVQTCNRRSQPPCMCPSWATEKRKSWISQHMAQCSEWNVFPNI